MSFDSFRSSIFPLNESCDSILKKSCNWTILDIGDYTVVTNLCIDCSFNAVYVNHLVYAADTVSLASSSSALQRLIDYCTKFAAQNGIFYNLKKSKWMCIRPKSARRTCIFQ